MSELDEDQRRAAQFFDGLPKPGIIEWFHDTEIGRAALKKLGQKLANRDGRREPDCSSR
jgi:hypothetical protein